MPWLYKTNRLGVMATAVKRRYDMDVMLAGEAPDLTTHKGRRDFGYIYLEFVAEATNTEGRNPQQIVNN